jgi:formylmethanofuran dehydrogenase subunit A
VCGKKLEKCLAYCGWQCKDERKRLVKVLMTQKPTGYLQRGANDVLSMRWDVLYKVAPAEIKQLMLRIERKLPLSIGREEH